MDEMFKKTIVACSAATVFGGGAFTIYSGLESMATARLKSVMETRLNADVQQPSELDVLSDAASKALKRALRNGN